MPGNTVRIGTQVTGVGKASSDLDRLRDKFDKIQKMGARGILQGVGIGAGIAAFNMLGSAVAGVTDYLMGAVEAAREDEVSISKLTASLNANVQGWQAHAGAIDAAIKSNQRLAFSDDETRESLALLVGATHDVNKALEIQGTAMDLARLKGISLADASTALVRVEGGQFRALKGLGIVLRDGATATEALAAVQKVAMGQADAYSKTAAASADRLGDSWDELSERVGYAVAGPMADAADSLTNLLVGVDDLAAALPKAADGSSIFADGLAQSADVLKFMVAPLLTLGDLLGEFQDGATKTGHAITDMKDDAYALNGEMRGLGNAITTKAIPATLDLSRANVRLKDSFHDLTDMANKWSDWVYGEIEGEDDLRHQFDLTNIELGDAKKRLKDLEAIKHPTADQRRDIAETRVEVDGLEGDAFNLRTQLALLGDKPSKKELARWLDERHIDLRTLDKDTLRWILHLRQAAGLYGRIDTTSGNERSSTATSGHAEGGWAGLRGPELSWLGEKGPEYVIPNDQLRSGRAPAGGGAPMAGGFSLTVNVTASPGMTPAAARQLGDAVGPVIVDYFGRRGLLSRSA